MRDLLQEYDTLMATGEPVGRAVVTSVWGSAPRPEGACMLATPSGRMAGSVSGGCVESAVAEEIRSAIARGTPRLVTFGVSDERAWEVGLACGGTIKVLVQPSVAGVAARGKGAWSRGARPGRHAPAERRWPRECGSSTPAGRRGR
jgi:xanthine dehydrogenase accessory factor